MSERLLAREGDARKRGHCLPVRTHFAVFARVGTAPVMLKLCSVLRVCERADVRRESVASSERWVTAMCSADTCGAVPAALRAECGVQAQ